MTFFLIHVFFDVESESEIDFRRSEPEVFDNPEKSRLLRVSSAG